MGRETLQQYPKEGECFDSSEENGAFRPGVYHIPSRREDLSVCFAVRWYQVTEDLKNAHKSAVQVIKTLTAFPAMKYSVLCFSVSSRGTKATLPPEFILKL